MARILILTSDRQVGRNIQGYMVLKGHSATTFTDPQAAILAADTDAPEVVVVDLLLAGRSGIEFLYELRSYPEWQSIPVIIVGAGSEYSIQSYGQAFAQLNVAAYLSLLHTPLAKLESRIQNLLQTA